MSFIEVGDQFLALSDERTQSQDESDALARYRRPTCPLPTASFVVEATDYLWLRGGAMKYALLIYPGAIADGEQPPDEEQQSIVAEYTALPGARRPRRRAAAAAGDRDDRAGAGREDADHRRAVRRHQGGARRLLPARGRRPRRALELAARIPAARMGGAVEVRPLVER